MVLLETVVGVGIRTAIVWRADRPARAIPRIEKCPHSVTNLTTKSNPLSAAKANLKPVLSQVLMLVNVIGDPPGLILWLLSD